MGVSIGGIRGSGDCRIHRDSPGWTGRLLRPKPNSGGGGFHRRVGNLDGAGLGQTIHFDLGLSRSRGHCHSRRFGSAAR